MSVFFNIEYHSLSGCLWSDKHWLACCDDEAMFHFIDKYWVSGFKCNPGQLQSQQGYQSKRCSSSKALSLASIDDKELASHTRQCELLSHIVFYKPYG